MKNVNRNVFYNQLVLHFHYENSTYLLNVKIMNIMRCRNYFDLIKCINNYLNSDVHNLVTKLKLQLILNKIKIKLIKLNTILLYSKMLL